LRQRGRSSAGRPETAGLAPAGLGEFGYDAELRPRHAGKDELGDAVAGLDQDALFAMIRSQRVAVPRRDETGSLVIGVDQTDGVAQYEPVAMTAAGARQDERAPFPARNAESPSPAAADRGSSARSNAKRC
jgi:hypothetical protein